MTIYVDLIFLLNLFFDFLLLLTVNNTLKRNAPLKKLILSSFLGSLTILVLFFDIPRLPLLFLKLILAIIMVVIAFGLKDKAYVIQNVSYFYMTSTVLGGFLYFLNLSFCENHNGLIFTYETISINYLFLVIFSPIMLYIYVKQRREVTHYKNIYKTTVYFKDGHILTLNSYLDTGNKLIDPVTKKKVIIVNKEQLNHIKANFLYVRFHSLNNTGLMKCISVKKIEINGKSSSNYLVGISEGALLKDGIDCILNYACEEEFL